MKAIETKNLVKRYEHVEAVKGIAFDIEEMEPCFPLVCPQ
jgi:ABC-type multidrug transport system ATPase subunit